MKTNIEDSSGNVFQDLKLPDAQRRLAKAEIASQICSLIKKKKLSQSRIAKLLKITQPKVSCLLSGALRGFSLEKLIFFLTVLGQDVNISTQPSSSGIGHVTVKTSIAAFKR